jgi:hypothetical protein
MKKWNVVLRLSSQTIPEKIDQAHYILASMEKDKEMFPTPLPSLEKVALITQELQELHTASRGGGKEITAKMYAKIFDFELELNTLANYVQDIANRDNEKGDVIILSAGMEFKKMTGPETPKFEVENTKVAGRVHLKTKGEVRASYIWEYSLDQEHWMSGKITRKSKTTLDNLKPGNRYYFRVAIVKEEQEPWSNVIHVIVT